MRIAVVGGTGMIGRRIAAALGRDGHDVRALSRRAPQYPVDLTTGAGLDTALRSCDVVVDASNGPPSRKARAVLVEGSRRLLDAEARAGVGHHVCVSIVGIEDVPVAYYRVKVAQERVVESAGVPWTIVRSTQFHDLLGAWLSAAGRRHVVPAAGALFQPVDVDEAGDAVAAVATARQVWRGQALRGLRFMTCVPSGACGGRRPAAARSRSRSRCQASSAAL